LSASTKAFLRPCIFSRNSAFLRADIFDESSSLVINFNALSNSEPCNFEIESIFVWNSPATLWAYEEKNNN